MFFFLIYTGVQRSKGRHKVPRQVSCERLFSSNTIYYKTVLLIHTQSLKVKFNSGSVALFLNVTVACKTLYTVQKSTVLTATASCNESARWWVSSGEIECISWWRGTTQHHCSLWGEGAAMGGVGAATKQLSLWLRRGSGWDGSIGFCLLIHRCDIRWLYCSAPGFIYTSRAGNQAGCAIYDCWETFQVWKCFQKPTSRY